MILQLMCKLFGTPQRQLSFPS